ncbi:hypothetical protein Bca52824_026225 [Brassica carinata]|uniref:Uncharacterized protein n=1 Tax=Brassica carinata TaxID=52824 RepID=A0A8X7SI65_BRACI|nr:hypothetical protein Bca52824_026225 [Brassica carinata]
MDTWCVVVRKPLHSGFRISVPKKKGRLFGLGRRSRSVPSSAAPPPFVDPEALMGQLRDKDDRISALETGWRLNRRALRHEEAERANDGDDEEVAPDETFIG